MNNMLSFLIKPFICMDVPGIQSEKSKEALKGYL